jgi:hypothetical protein
VILVDANLLLYRRIGQLLCETASAAPGGKGDHEIWYSPIAKRRFMVDF